MSDFQRRHYVKLAEFWKDQRHNSNGPMTYQLYKNFKKMLGRENPQFKESVFDKASGYTD